MLSIIVNDDGNTNVSGNGSVGQMVVDTLIAIAAVYDALRCKGGEEQAQFFKEAITDEVMRGSVFNFSTEEDEEVLLN